MRKKKAISIYEMQQVNQFLYDIYLKYGQGLDEDNCRSEGWIAYIEGKERYQYDIGDIVYWTYVRSNMQNMLKQMRNIRNERIRFESKLSLNSVSGKEGEEFGSFLFPVQGDFVNGIVLWDYVKRLGPLKYQIVKLMYEQEDDYNIMKRLHLEYEEYFKIKLELRKDFVRYKED